mgnify:CR=1 FL=1
MIVLAIDPSGNFTEGKGTTGWAAFTKDSLVLCGQIKAEAECFTNQHEYYNRHIELIKTINQDKEKLLNKTFSKRTTMLWQEF